MDLTNASKSIALVAKEKCVPVSKVEDEIRDMIQKGLQDPDDRIREKWEQLCIGERPPSPEEFIAILQSPHPFLLAYLMSQYSKTSSI